MVFIVEVYGADFNSNIIWFIWFCKMINEVNFVFQNFGCMKYTFATFSVLIYMSTVWIDVY